ncbi:MAG: type I-E CRISPR-associated endoribonuclease Cas2e [Clostridiales bacterium]|jgi:CRISPR-associated protein Cas2|nr:type I-E CRISPR-associated endoribonuclease Cas2e [Clostridiales bacterium]
MIVLNLTDCPMSLRGDLTRWLFEISSGVYVGQVSARVRDAIWERIVENCKTGRATLVYSSDGEQKLNFRVHGEVWEPIDFDGIRLMLRPSISRLMSQKSASHGFSDAAKIRKAKRFASNLRNTQSVESVQNAPNERNERNERSAPNERNERNERNANYPTDYVVVDVETTGLLPDTDEIIEIGAVKVISGKQTDTFGALIRADKNVPPSISALTGITDEMLQKDGKDSKDVLQSFLKFIDKMPLVAHNASFDINFLLRACKKQGFSIFTNRVIDTLALAKRYLKELPNHKLETVAIHFGLDTSEAHRSLKDCRLTHIVYEKLIKIASERDKESPK